MSRGPILRPLLATFALASGIGATALADTNGLVAAYGFEEVTGSIVLDSSGFGNTGTINGAEREPAGRFGRALSFDGSAIVSVPDSASLHVSNAMTLEAWVFATELGGWRDIIYKGLDDAYYLEGSSDAGPPALGGQFASSPLYAPNTLPLNTWVHLVGTYNGTRLRFYVNGALASSQLQSGPIDSSTGPLTIGGDNLYGQHWVGKIDEVRVYNRLLTVEEIQADMLTPITQPSSDRTPPQVSISVPASGATLSHVADLTASATDNEIVEAVEFKIDDAVVAIASAPPFTVRWNTATVTNGMYVLSAVAVDAAGNQGTSAPVQITISNPVFVNEVVVPDIVSATTMVFLPDGRMLVGELTEKIWVVQPGANQPDATPVLQLDSSQLSGEQGLMDIALDPAFSQNNYIYVFYTRGASGGNNRNRVSRFTLSGNTVVLGSEFVLWRDLVTAQAEHHGGALAFGSDGRLYITVGDQFSSDEAQELDSYHGKVLRINSDGSIPTDNPFHDANGPNLDEIWALGLRNPYRMSIDPVTGRMFIGDVGGNDNGTAMEEINIGAPGANYGWPLCEGDCPSLGSGYTPPLFAYPHNGRDACVTGGFVYHGNALPAEYEGNYFFADYVQNWIKRLILDGNGNLVDVVDFEPPDGTKDGPYGDPVKLVEGLDGAIYYIDLGFNDAHVPNPAAIRRIRHVLSGNRPPVPIVNATPMSGAAPLAVTFSSAGSFDPEGTTLTYDWQFGDGSSSAQAGPTHIYANPGEYTARLSLSDGVNTTLSSNLVIAAGGRPIATIQSPVDGSTFRAGDVIQFAGAASDVEDGKLPASAYSWSILFHHEGHIHPGTVVTNTTTGTLGIPISGHDFQGATSYEIVLSVTDSDGLRGSASATIFPEKVNLSFDTTPSGLALEIAGIRKISPFVIDALIGFHYQVNAPQQSQDGASYQFLSWSDGGTPSHMIVVPDADATFVAAYEVPVNLVIQQLAGGIVRLHFIGTPGRVYRVEASANLRDWQTIGNAVASNDEVFEFEDPDARLSQRFYRCVTP